MSTRLYHITYEEDGESLECVVPEYLLPEFEEIEDINVVGWLVPGYKIVVDEEPDPGEKEPIPLKKTENG